MEEIKEEFQKNIYEYCDHNLGKKVLFPAFRHLCPPFYIAPREITSLTSNIVNELVTERILEEINTPDNFVTGYPMYEILGYKS